MPLVVGTGQLIWFKEGMEMEIKGGSIPSLMISLREALMVLPYQKAGVNLEQEHVPAADGQLPWQEGAQSERAQCDSPREGDQERVKER